jgi:predicted esterase
MSRGLSFIHRFEPGTDVGSPPLLLLHGTGGNEDDLIPLGRMVAPNSALLSPRGKVLEAGMQRNATTRPMHFNKANVRKATIILTASELPV